MTAEVELRDAAPPLTRAAAAVRPKRRRRAWIAGAFLLAAAIYFGFGWFVAYTEDAYIQSDLVAVAPEVAGIVQSVVVHYNQWVSAGDLIATIDPRPFQLEVDLKQQRVAVLAAAGLVTSQSRDAQAAKLKP